MGHRDPLLQTTFDKQAKTPRTDNATALRGTGLYPRSRKELAAALGVLFTGHYAFRHTEDTDVSDNFDLKIRGAGRWQPLQIKMATLENTPGQLALDDFMSDLTLISETIPGTRVRDRTLSVDSPGTFLAVIRDLVAHNNAQTLDQAEDTLAKLVRRKGRLEKLAVRGAVFAAAHPGECLEQLPPTTFLNAAHVNAAAAALERHEQNGWMPFSLAMLEAVVLQETGQTQTGVNPLLRLH